MRLTRKFNYFYSSILILALCISAYAVKLTDFSPIYFVYILVLPISFLVLLMYRRTFSITSDVFLVFLLLSYVLIFHFIHLNNGTAVNLIVSLLGYIYLRFARFTISLKQYSRIINAMVVFNLVILGIDSLYRLLNPTHPDVDKIELYADSQDKWFYLYKFNSLMFSDSNDTALVLIVLFFTVLLMPRQYFSLSKSKIYFVIIFLILFTFSRAAYFVTILGFLNYKMASFSRLNKLIIRSGLIISGIISISIIYSLLLSDDSFAVRLDIISMIFDLQSKTSFSKLFIGVGPGQGEEALGIYTHIFYLTYILELGILGLLLILTFFFLYMYRYGNIVLFPVLTIGLSFFLYLGTPFLFVPLALIANIYDLQRNRIQNFKLSNKICVE
jgi:hypothetical protein